MTKAPESDAMPDMWMCPGLQFMQNTLEKGHLKSDGVPCEEWHPIMVPKMFFEVPNDKSVSNLSCCDRANDVNNPKVSFTRTGFTASGDSIYNMNGMSPEHDVPLVPIEMVDDVLKKVLRMIMVPGENLKTTQYHGWRKANGDLNHAYTDPFMSAYCSNSSFNDKPVCACMNRASYDRLNKITTVEIGRAHV